jgi:hypothetical protein
MYDVILVIAVLVFVFLAIRLAMKLRQMSRWSDEDTVVSTKGKSVLPPDLRELKIDDPPRDAINRLDDPDEIRTSGDDMLPKQT